MNQQPIQPSTIFRHVFAIYAPMAMLAGMQLDIFTPLKNGPMTADELAKALGVAPVKLQVLLYALVYAELLTVEGNRFMNSSEADAYLIRGRTGYLGSNHENYSDLWSNLLKLGQSIRLNAPQGKHNFRAMSDTELGAFLRGLHAGATATGEQLVREFGLDRAKTLLDVGGGSGGVAIAACQACPELSATIIELPRVAPFARSRVEEAKLSNRIQVAVADILQQPPQGRFDAAVLRHFIQIMGPEAAQRAIENVSRAISPGGDLFIVGHVVESNRVSPGPAVGQSLVFLTLYDEGRAYAEQEYRAWLTEAGFSDISVRYCVASGGASVITARKAD